MKRTQLKAKKGFKRPTEFKPQKPRTPLKKRSQLKNKPTKAKKKSPKSLKRKLDAIYSEYIRRSASDQEGFVNCYCGVRVHWKESDNSHYIPRGCLALRYDPRNTAPSCRRCNRYMGGNLQAYAQFLEARYGYGILQELEKERRQIIPNFPYEEKITLYTKLISELWLQENTSPTKNEKHTGVSKTK